MMFFWIWTGFKRCVWHSGSQDFAKTLDYELRYTWKNSWVVFIVVVRAHFVWWGYIRQFWSALRCSTGELPRSASLCGLRLQALRDSTSPRARCPLFRWWHSALQFHSIRIIQQIKLRPCVPWRHACISDLRKWMYQDKLKINDEKTEFLIIGSK